MTDFRTEDDGFHAGNDGSSDNVRLAQAPAGAESCRQLQYTNDDSSTETWRFFPWKVTIWGDQAEYTGAKICRIAYCILHIAWILDIGYWCCRILVKMCGLSTEVPLSLPFRWVYPWRIERTLSCDLFCVWVYFRFAWKSLVGLAVMIVFDDACKEEGCSPQVSLPKTAFDWKTCFRFSVFGKQLSKRVGFANFYWNGRFFNRN